MRRYIQVIAVLLLLLPLGAWVEAFPLWQQFGIMNAPATVTDSGLSEPMSLVVFATVMAFSARQLRRRRSAK